MGAVVGALHVREDVRVGPVVLVTGRTIAAAQRLDMAAGDDDDLQPLAEQGVDDWAVVSASLERFFRPAVWLPCMSIVAMSSGFKKPFECIVGVQSTSLSPRRTVMLPSLAAANPLL